MTYTNLRFFLNMKINYLIKYIYLVYYYIGTIIHEKNTFPSKLEQNKLFLI